MNTSEWSIRELEPIYVNIFILEENTYLKIEEKIRKQKIYIFIGLNLKGYKEIIGVYYPEEETTSYWSKEINELRTRGIKDIFMISMINNKWLKKVFKINYPNARQAPSMIEFYNKTYYYIARKHHRIIMREISRIYKAEDIEEAKKIYYNLKEEYKENKLLIMIIDKYIKEIFDMFKYGHQARVITSNTDSYNKMRNNIRWNMNKKQLFNNQKELKEYMNNLLKKEEEKWHPSIKNWDKIIQELDCDLADKIYDLV